MDYMQMTNNCKATSDQTGEHANQHTYQNLDTDSVNQQFKIKLKSKSIGTSIISNYILY